ncbi:MAG TPA: GAF domain-containing protein [Rhodospirillaceae bacterium]|nr:GAF domain-containing protein [Rhodospirillaceae bacterium]
MDRLAALVAGNLRLAWTLTLTVIAVGCVLVGMTVRDLREAGRLSLLQTAASRLGLEIMSQTLNGNVMGELSLLGVIDPEVKLDAGGAAPLNNPSILFLLEQVGRSHDAQGVFVVGGNGVVQSSWDSSGRPSTGLNVRFRPYFQMAMQGQDNVYAAISLARGDRGLYFTSPVRATSDRASPPKGAVVARTGIERVDALLRKAGATALLLSPQGVVFATSRPEWVGYLAGTATAERLRAIRELKQFGTLFDGREPQVLPFPAEAGLRQAQGHRQAVATTPIHWNDPSGDWMLVLMEDLSGSVPLAGPLWAGLGSFALLALIAGLGLTLLAGRHTQALAVRRIEIYARAQEASADRKSRRAEAAFGLQRCKSLPEVGTVFLAETHRLFGALQGLVYVFATDAAPVMDLVSSYACEDGVAKALEPGQGLLGQCALDRQVRVLDTHDQGSWTIRSGLGNTRPAAVMIAPLLLDQAVLGVVEIAVLDPPDDAVREEFAEMASLLAFNVEILRRAAPVTAEVAS